MSEIKRQDFIEDEALLAPLAMRDNIRELIKEVDILKGKLKTVSEEMDNSGMSVSNTKKNTEELTVQQRELAKIQTQTATIVAKTNDEYIAQAKALAEAKKQLKDKIALGDRDAKTLTAQNASTKELTAALAKNRDAYKSLANEEAKATKEGKELKAIIDQQEKAVRGTNESLGDFTDNVGNYQKGLAGLKEELKATKDEMANIAKNSGTSSDEFVAAAARAGELKDEIGDLNDAISNTSASPYENLGNTFSDVGGKLKNLDFGGATQSASQFAKISKQMTFKEAIAGGKSFTQTIWTMTKALLANPLFLLAAIIVGVVVAVYKLKDVVKPLTIVFDLFNEALEYAVQLLKDFTDWLGLTSFAADEKAQAIIDGANKEIEAIKKRYDEEVKMAEAAGKDTLELEKEKWEAVTEQAVNGLSAVRDLQTRAGKEQKAELEKQAEEFNNTIREAYVEIQILEAKHQSDLAKKREEAAKKQMENQLRLQGDIYKLNKFRVEQELETQKDIIAAIDSSEAEKFKAVERATQLRIKLARMEAAEQLRAGKLTSAGIILVREQLNANIKEAEQQAADERVKINKDEAERIKKIHDDRLEDARKAADERVRLANASATMVVDAVKREVIEGIITREQGEKEIQKLQKDLADDAIAENIRALNEILNNEELTKEEREQLQVELFKLQSDLTEALYQQIEEAGQTNAQKIAEQLEKINGIYSEFSMSLGMLTDSLTERNLQNLDQEENALEEKYRREMDLAEGNLVAQAELTAVFERKRLEIEKKKIEAQRKAAIFDKAVSATQAAIATALGVTKALPNIPLAIATGIFGAIQVAAILARPIPAFEFGGDHKGGLALVGDGNGAELIKEPGKRPYLSPSTPTILDLPNNTKISSHEDTVRELALGAVFGGLSDSTRGGKSDGRLLKEVKGLRKDIRNQKGVEINMSRRGIERAISNGNTRTWFLDNIYK
jgi:hypothetical protein